MLEYEELVTQFLTYDLDSLKAISEKIVTKFEDGNLFPPYVPLVGGNYPSTKLLIYGMAQNLDEKNIASFIANEFSNRQLAERMKYGWDHKLFVTNRIEFHQVLIEPYNVGILPALAGIYSQIHLDKKFESLKDVHEHIAVSNYYKFSIHRGRKDINPNGLRSDVLAREKYREYFRVNDELVELELDTLKPDVILLFRGAHLKKLKEWKKSRGSSTRIIIINDPSWILRGGGGCLKPEGSWGKIASEFDQNDMLKRHVTGYMSEIIGNHEDVNKSQSYRGKLKATEIYLLKYARIWMSDFIKEKNKQERY